MFMASSTWSGERLKPEKMDPELDLETTEAGSNPPNYCEHREQSDLDQEEVE